MGPGMCQNRSVVPPLLAYPPAGLAHMCMSASALRMQGRCAEQMPLQSSALLQHGRGEPCGHASARRQALHLVGVLQRQQHLLRCIPAPHQHLPGRQVCIEADGGCKVAAAAGGVVGDQVRPRRQHLDALELRAHCEGLHAGATRPSVLRPLSIVCFPGYTRLHQNQHITSCIATCWSMPTTVPGGTSSISRAAPLWASSLAWSGSKSTV